MGNSRARWFRRIRSKQRPFPPRGSSSSLHRYYGLLGLPLGSSRFRSPPYTPASSTQGPPRRVSPVPSSAMPASRPLYPGGVLRHLYEAGPQRSVFAVCCLRRDMGGSASTPFRLKIYRGLVGGSLALRAAGLLPPHTRRLSSPRSAPEISLQHWGQLRGVRWTYLGGTYTRRSTTAWQDAPCGRSYHRSLGEFQYYRDRNDTPRRLSQPQPSARPFGGVDDGGGEHPGADGAPAAGAQIRGVVSVRPALREGDVSGGEDQAARNRRTRLLSDRAFRKEPLLQAALNHLAYDEVFEKQIVSLSWHHVPRTNNHVERKNRTFRLVQKTRYSACPSHDQARLLAPSPARLVQPSACKRPGCQARPHPASRARRSSASLLRHPATARRRPPPSSGGRREGGDNRRGLSSKPVRYLIHGPSVITLSR